MSIWTLGLNLIKTNYPIKNIINSDYRHAQRVFKTFNNDKNLGDDHDLYVQSDVIL